MKILRKVYTNKPFRMAFKMIVCLSAVKVIGDAYFWLNAGLHLTFPRYTFQFEGSQQPLSPPIMKPYPLVKEADQPIQIYKYNQYNEKIAQILYQKPLLLKKLYKNNPERETDYIDHFLFYSEANRLSDILNLRVLNKMKNNGAQIPENINKKIRELSQFQFYSMNSTVKPEL